MASADLNQRVAALEKTVDELQKQIRKLGASPGRWWVDHAGRFANDPVFDEMVELGRQYRESLRPEKRKGKRDRT